MNDKKKRPCVYMLLCKDGTLYTGWTNDFEKRIEAHNSGKGAKYTRGRGPVTPVYMELMEDHSAAAKREAAIKKLPLKKKLLLLDSPLNALLSHK
ncbi:MAG: GIY-YIG nuclease family protein [Anaerovoracaceae bacterium]|nr:GIY-YIG nuclease family protein [Anaerovoracaceae bacterium]